MKRLALLVAFLMCVAGCSGPHAPQQDDPLQTPYVTAAPSPASPEPSALEMALTELPDEYLPEEAAANGDYVNVHGKVSNEEKLTAFLDAVSQKDTAAIRTVNFTVEGDAIIADIVFDGSMFTVYMDTTRDMYGERKLTQKDYQNICEYEQQGSVYVFLTNEAKVTKELLESGFDGHLLAVRQTPFF